MRSAVLLTVWDDSRSERLASQIVRSYRLAVLLGKGRSLLCY
jgi:hypothetical protein